jgi:hypothetical protein
MRQGGVETYTLPRLMISFTPVTGLIFTAAIGVCNLRFPSVTSTPITMGSFLLNTATGFNTHGKVM